MCKLCNTDRESISFVKKNGITNHFSPISIAIANTIKEYIDSYPCIRCIDTIRLSPLLGSIGIDNLITNRLISSYITSKITGVPKHTISQKRTSILVHSTTKRASNPTKQQHKARYKKRKDKILKYKRETTKTENVEKFITKVVNIKTNTERFRFVKITNNIRVSKTFHTLKEAQQFKQEILDEKYNRTS